jgi:hypothetical protein
MSATSYWMKHGVLPWENVHGWTSLSGVLMERLSLY